MNLGPTELVIIFLIILLIFGGAKLPKLAKSLGEAKREFEKTVDDDSSASPKAVEAAPLNREDELRQREEAVRQREEELRNSGGDQPS